MTVFTGFDDYGDTPLNFAILLLLNRLNNYGC
jgi:hypothetical protein